MSATCECWFLDVGQGASNVILLGNRRAIVIDCGPRGSSQTFHLLKTHVDYIEALIVTHNDSDHDYNVPSIIGAYPKAIGRILFLEDRSAGQIETFNTISLLMSEKKEDYPIPERLEVNGTKPKVIFSENDLTLTIMYPDLMGNLSAQNTSTRRANRTSAILRLSCGPRSVVFSGDATVEAWEYLSINLPNETPLFCDIMTVPHHGGRISTSESQEVQAQKKLYTEIIRPEYGIISVGTRNRDRHPFPETILALKEAGVKTLCTQITKRCCENLESARSIERVLFKPCRSSRNKSTTQTGKSRHVACYSTVVAEVSPAEITLSNIQVHLRFMERLSSIEGFSGMCRSAN